MKKLIKLFAVCSVVLAAVSVAGLCAADNADAAPIQPAAATYGGLDIGTYGWSSPEAYEWDTDLIYSVARYKNNSSYHSAGNAWHSAESVGGGWSYWLVHCVSDGEDATEYAYITDGTNKSDTTPYKDTYGTTGYTNKLHIKGHLGSVGTGIYVSKAAWCPDGDTDTIMDYINYKIAMGD